MGSVSLTRRAPLLLVAAVVVLVAAACDVSWTPLTKAVLGVDGEINVVEAQRPHMGATSLADEVSGIAISADVTETSQRGSRTDADAEVPTVAPTEVPTEVPTVAPTEVPTVAPTEVPTVAPTEVPTVAPTEVPTEVPTAAPTEVPTASTGVPTEVPAALPDSVALATGASVLAPSPLTPPTSPTPTSPTPTSPPPPTPAPPTPAPPTPTPPPPPTPAPPTPPPPPTAAPAPTIEQRGRSALATVGFDPASVGYTISFLPGRDGHLGLTFTVERRIEIYIRPSMSNSQIAYIIGHEMGHAVDHIRNSTADRERWKAARGIDPTMNWWPTGLGSDRATPAGDFAECFATWSMGAPSSSAWGSCGGQMSLMSELIGG